MYIGIQALITNHQTKTIPIESNVFKFVVAMYDNCLFLIKFLIELRQSLRQKYHKFSNYSSFQINTLQYKTNIKKF